MYLAYLTVWMATCYAPQTPGYQPPFVLWIVDLINLYIHEAGHNAIMIDGIQDRIARGLGVAARAIGAPASAFRASSAENPLEARNRFLRLPAVFHIGKNFDRPSEYDAPLWQGIFDSAYTRPGDYLVQDTATWFIASQPRLLPVLCVQVNRTLSFFRPEGPDAVGVNVYVGLRRDTLRPLLRNWPASMLGARAAGAPAADLPSDTVLANWTVLLPAFSGVTLRAGDRIEDDLTRVGVIANADLTDLGWRLAVREVAV